MIVRCLDCELWKTGNGYVVSVPTKIVRKFNLKVGVPMEVTIKFFVGGGKKNNLFGAKMLSSKGNPAGFQKEKKKR